MLASTVQFSTYDQTPPHTPPPDPRTPTGDTAVREQEGPAQSNAHPRQGRPVPSGPNSVPTTSPPRTDRVPHPPEAGRTRQRPEPPAELVSVPPSSSTPDTRSHPQLDDRHGLGTALDHTHEVRGQCSLERR